MDAGAVHVELRGVSKRFGTTRAADAVDLSIARGTVHALVGENGAGKSTLARIISGVIPPDSGTVLVNGEPVDFGSPRQAFEAGITMMAQELSLVPERSVGENVFLGIEPAVAGFVDRRRLRQRFDELVGRSGVVASSRSISATPSDSFNFVFGVIAAIVVGGTSIAGGDGAVWRTLLGALFIAFMVNGFNLHEIDPIWQRVILGAAILVAVILDARSRAQRFHRGDVPAASQERPAARGVGGTKKEKP